MFRLKGVVAVAGAVGMSLLVSGQALAVTWHSKVALTSSRDVDGAALVTLGASHAFAAYEETGRIRYRRSGNSAASWKAAVRLDTAGSGYVAAAGYGTHVDVTWTKESNFGQDSVLKYAASSNYGRTFSKTPLISLSDPSGTAIVSGVGHGPGGMVAVAWWQLVGSAQSLRVLVSNNDGTSFGAAHTIATPSATYAYPPSVAVGNGVIYVAYFASDTEIDVRSSTDGGSNWSGVTTLATRGNSLDDTRGVSIAADGGTAHVAFAVNSAGHKWIKSRTTTNSGASWGAAVDISPRTGYGSYHPVLSFIGGTARVVYDQCRDASCVKVAVKYSYSASGAAWSAAQKVSHKVKWADAAGVGFASKIIVLYTAFHSGSIYNSQSDLYSRTN